MMNTSYVHFKIDLRNHRKDENIHDEHALSPKVLQQEAVLLVVSEAVPKVLPEAVPKVLPEAVPKVLPEAVLLVAL